MILDLPRVRWAIRGLPDPVLAIVLYRISLHTMTRPKRAKALWRICKAVLENRVHGHFVECGVWRGGSAGLMALCLQKFAESNDRMLYLYDSFEGLPPPSPEDGEVAARYWQTTGSAGDDSSERCVASLETVQSLLFDSLGIARDSVIIHPGWFQQTLEEPENLPSNISLLRLDGDWYESTKICFETLYNRVSKGGAVVLDDYFCWEGCRTATDEYRKLHRIHTPIQRIDSDSGYWIKQ